MNVDSKLAKKLIDGGFIVTVEFQPKAAAGSAAIESAIQSMGSGFTAVNVADNCHCIGMSSVAASVAMLKSGVEPVYQIVTRDRNLIALQSDLLGAASLGIKNVLCLSGYHQALATCPESSNVYDIDSTQLIQIATTMVEKGVLADGSKIEGMFSMLFGAVANPFQKPLELNMLRVQKKVEAGAKFIQTSPVFDLETFGNWMSAAVKSGITAKAAILAGVLPLDSVEEALRLRKTYTDYSIPDSVIERLKKAGNAGAQMKEGVAICLETINKLKSIKGLRGIHVHSGCNGTASPEAVSASLS
jgi:methylenetetrahydrofolate reductase (NADPH)